ncbi:MAG: enoyl-CoA hydratase/isomerase family protein [Acidobacteria bacterium]|nr:enoyl-CoA hydratase/isomerase family protein [Acidobacteriota bacterium]
MLTILSEQRGAVGVITINRPERFNAMDVQTAQDFRRAALRLARDTDVRVVILQGLPGMFCSGADLKFIRNGGSSGDLEYLTRAEYRRPPEGTPIQYGEVFKQILEYIHSAISEIRRAPKPFIAAVDGVAAAGGLGIAMACDIVVASQRASFEWAYSKTALTGAESTTFMLPRLIGLRRSLELLFLNPRLTADEARDVGLVTRVFEVEPFAAEVAAMAERLAQGPPRAFAIAKELMNQSAGMDRLDDHLDRELEELARAANGPEFAEGLLAFFEKRPPRFPAATGPRPQGADHHA